MYYSEKNYDFKRNKYKVYREDGKELFGELHTYEIGSITKTITAGLINKEIQEGKISLSDTIDTYLELPSGNSYPTIEDLLTHTSGYNSYYFEKPMVANFFKSRNDFYGATEEMSMNRLSHLSVEEESYDFKYSNIGFATLGLILESVYNTDYKVLADNFLRTSWSL